MSNDMNTGRSPTLSRTARKFDASASRGRLSASSPTAYHCRSGSQKRSLNADLRATAHSAYVAAHNEIRKLDDGGDYAGAVKLAVGPQASGTFTAYTDRIGQSVEAHKATFTAEVGKAGRGLGPLTIVGPLLALLACGFAVAGIRARLEEYR